MARTPHRTAARAVEAQRRIREAGERVTTPRSAVLAALLAADHALTHHEVEEALAPVTPVDRVTVYRVLDRLVATGLAHRIPGEDRTWRFGATRRGPGGAHAHFTCSGCGRTVCLEETEVPAAVKVPRGFVPQRIELTVQGLCAACR